MKIIRLGYIIFPLFGLVYYVLMRSGFSTPVPSPGQVMYSLPMLVCSFLLVGPVALEIFKQKKETTKETAILLVGVTLMAGGYWTSALTRYDMVTVITEGQAVQPENIERVPGSGYVGAYARPAPFEVQLIRLHPVLGPDGGSLKNIEGEFLLRSEGKEKAVRIGSSCSRVAGFTRMSISDMGYSPRYELRTTNSDLIDSSFVFLKLFPAGREDSFRLLAPLTYYVRYYPESGDSSGLLHVRIARNKDIVFDRDVMPGEEIRFENARMRFPEIRKWTILEITRDYGMPVFWLGVVLGLIGACIRLRHRKK